MLVPLLSHFIISRAAPLNMHLEANPLFWLATQAGNVGLFARSGLPTLMQYHSPAALFFSSSSSTNAYFLSFYQLQTLCRSVFLTDSFRAEIEWPWRNLLSLCFLSSMEARLGSKWSWTNRHPAFSWLNCSEKVYWKLWSPDVHFVWWCPVEKRKHRTHNRLLM